MTEETSSQPFIGPATQEDHQHAKMGFTGLKLGASDSPLDQTAAKRKKLSVGDVFNQDDEATSASKKRKLVP
ncbi:hypothetical protein GH825_30855, partial [Bacillus thuringiensis]|nr:hypothetical protein [Bacillus thuringiensis]